MRILVVEDDAPLASVIVRSLREEAYAVDQAADGQEGEWLAIENPYDLIILDLMLPRKNGLEVLHAVRDQGIKAPVLILTAKDTTKDVVTGLDTGADDYMKKPFSIDELLARVRTLLRRQPTQAKAIIEAGPIKIDPAKRLVTVFNQPIDVTTKEYALIEFFARNAGSVVSRVELSEHVWDQNFEPTSNVVDVYIGYLRNKIDKAFGTNIIKTVRGHGYMLDVSGLSAGSDSHAAADEGKPAADAD